MTDLDYTILRKVVRDATQGEWEIRSDTCGSEYGDYTIYGGKETGIALAFAYCEGMSKEDATFIATFDPPTVLALLDTIQRVREAMNDLDHARATGETYTYGQIQHSIRQALGED